MGAIIARNSGPAKGVWDDYFKVALRDHTEVTQDILKQVLRPRCLSDDLFHFLHFFLCLFICLFVYRFVYRVICW